MLGPEEQKRLDLATKRVLARHPHPEYRAHAHCEMADEVRREFDYLTHLADAAQSIIRISAAQRPHMGCDP